MFLIDIASDPRTRTGWPCVDPWIIKPVFSQNDDIVKNRSLNREKISRRESLSEIDLMIEKLSMRFFTDRATRRELCFLG